MTDQKAAAKTEKRFPVKRADITMQEAETLVNALRRTSTLKDYPFKVVNALNRRLLDPVLLAIKELKDGTEVEGIDKYHEKRNEMILAFAEKNEAGDAVGTPGPLGGTTYSFGDRTKEAQKAIEAVNVEFKDVLDAQEKAGEDLQEALNSKIDVPSLYSVSLEDLPEALSGEDTYTLMPMIDGMPKAEVED